MSSPTTDLMHGAAQELADAGVCTYRSDGTAYLAGETALVQIVMPQAPDRVICLTEYVVNDDAANPWSTVRIQVRMRSLPYNPDDLRALRDAVYAVWQSDDARTYGSVTVSQSRRISGIPLGIDINNRLEYADNYQFDVQLPATANRP